MKKIYYTLIIYACLIGTIFALILLSTDQWDPLLVNLIIINIIMYIVRKPIKAFFAYIFRKQIYRTFISIILNVIFAVFILWLLFVLSRDLFIALVSFLVVTVSFTLKTIINNIAAGAFMLAAEQFNIGDLVETNGIQGLIREISLNHTRIEELDGTNVVLPNSNIFGSTMVKFTHKRLKSMDDMQFEEIKKNRKAYRQYLKRFKKIMNIERKITRYVKPIEILGSVDSKKLDDSLSRVASKYEKIFGKRPDYAVDTMAWGRLKINLYVTSRTPQLLIDNLDAFLRDFIFELYSKEIYEGWEEYKKNNDTIELHYEVNNA